jgi:hypothetical protein
MTPELWNILNVVADIWIVLVGLIILAIAVCVIGWAERNL